MEFFEVVRSYDYKNNRDYYDADYVSVCKMIRNYAESGRLYINMDKEQADGDVKYLFKMIVACGLEIEEFIRGYLSVLQPYMLNKLQDNDRYKEDFVLGCELGKVALVIKIDESNKDTPMKIHFQKSNLVRSGGRICERWERKCTIIADKIKCFPKGYIIDYYVQRGFVRHKIQSAAKDVKDGVAKIDSSEIQLRIEGKMQLVNSTIFNNYIEYSEKAGVLLTEGANGKVFATFFGYSISNNIVILINAYSDCRDIKSKCYVVQLTAEILENMSDDERECLKKELVNKKRHPLNELYYAIMSY